ncbi:hypothetical protein [Thalassoroseus pseudoceratinae]|uniref:hypothetical protein n=1 Tax=Thalassoroseus pseudoceratinae TaxID=2713176 RepID=UPI001420E143|nr:hypothetical protein [Thalassoroseus pseudoceratinae]
MPTARMSRWLFCSFAAYALTVGLPAIGFSAPPATVEPETSEKPSVEPKTDADETKLEHPESRYIRIRRNDDGEPLALETSIVRFVPAAGKPDVVLDLIGAVHVGDTSYYRTLNEEFTKYDVVLYELVAEKGTRVPKGGRKGGDMFPVQMLKNMLKLDSQLRVVDYSKENFKHADMSPAEMKKAMEERGDTGFTLILGILRDMIRESNRMAAKQAADPGSVPQISLMDLLFNPDGGKKLRRMMALQLGDPQASAALGETLNTLLVEDRNQAALKVYQEELDKGTKKIAIFYGAAHMPDFEERLVKKFGMKVDNVRWVEAWDLK